MIQSEKSKPPLQTKGDLHILMNNSVFLCLLAAVKLIERNLVQYGDLHNLILCELGSIFHCRIYGALYFFIFLIQIITTCANSSEDNHSLDEALSALLHFLLYRGLNLFLHRFLHILDDLFLCVVGHIAEKISDFCFKIQFFTLLTTFLTTIAHVLTSLKTF